MPLGHYIVVVFVDFYLMFPSGWLQSCIGYQCSSMMISTTFSMSNIKPKDNVQKDILVSRSF